MWKIYRLVKKIIRRITRLRIMVQGDQYAVPDCYQSACELEKIQVWYENHEDLWKQTIRGRIIARVLYKAHRAISDAEGLLGNPKGDQPL
ncbi:hypothetical protein IDJ77_03820 [Mucilaginibacter sp. ZT4R22]|uniref:Uncharacterized protein n=1 Tax=Mucilaginibacter pankratovii TaxID=2772110 RepID=A0ABR7WLD5_9SPHI|nr:hypothetical protein [Mucilaginibacter pankratovii]MBD1362928.1 hypothetical protein [Mucilaginibacter pankratovii]